MNPRKANTLIAEVATETGYPEEVVETVVMYYWREVRKHLSNMSHTRVHVTNLGDFVVKHWKIDERIEQLEKWEERNRQKGLQRMTARFRIAEQLYELKNIKTILEEEKQRAEFVRLHKRTIYEQDTIIAGKRDKNLESSKPDH